jgi:nucleotide-binding universal stress UspA family protein
MKGIGNTATVPGGAIMIKDIVVYLDGSAEDETRLGQAEPLAAAFGSHITGIYIQSLPDVVAVADPAGSQILHELIDEARRNAEQAEKALRLRFGRLAASNELRTGEAFPGLAGDELAAAARVADLFIGSLPYVDRTRSPRIIEAVLFDSGRPCLFVPPASKAPDNIDTILIAWKNTREAARAVAGAMPLLQRAKVVVVGTVEEERAGEPPKLEPGAAIARHLERHGVNVQLRHLTGTGNAAEALMTEAGRAAAQLMVMGAYGHSRLREWLLGGVTRTVLERSEMPVLAAH